mmetsp:Transcript_3260/g.8432  ORF Transcript_3260/g.8432 Transcript_3260/m.8432 type:complete len:373 (-) Transcript_3260:1301-2419(-)
MSSIRLASCTASGSHAAPLALESMASSTTSVASSTASGASASSASASSGRASTASASSTSASSASASRVPLITSTAGVSARLTVDTSTGRAFFGRRRLRATASSPEVFESAPLDGEVAAVAPVVVGGGEVAAIPSSTFTLSAAGSETLRRGLGEICGTCASVSPSVVASFCGSSAAAATTFLGDAFFVRAAPPLRPPATAIAGESLWLGVGASLLGDTIVPFEAVPFDGECAQALPLAVDATAPRLDAVLQTCAPAMCTLSLAPLKYEAMTPDTLRRQRRNGFAADTKSCPTKPAPSSRTPHMSSSSSASRSDQRNGRKAAAALRLPFWDGRPAGTGPSPQRLTKRPPRRLHKKTRTNAPAATPPLAPAPPP